MERADPDNRILALLLDRDKSVEVKTEAIRSQKEQHRQKQIKKDKISTSLTLKKKKFTTDRVTNSFTKIENCFFDNLAKILTAPAQIVYFQLYRLSYGWGQEQCQIGYKTLSERTSLSRNTIICAIKELHQKKFIEEISWSQQGSIYHIFLPRNMLANSIPNGGIPNGGIPSIPNGGIPNNGILNKNIDTTTKNTGIPNSGIPKFAPIKENKIFKENIKESVCVQKSTLRVLEGLVEKFYSLMDQKISTHTRTRSLIQINQLLSDGFTLDEIDYAVGWTVKNKQNAHSFGFVAETIGEALREKRKELKKKAKLEEEKRKLEEEKQREEARLKLEEKIAEIREQMSFEEREALRKEAEVRIRDDPEITSEARRYAKKLLLSFKERELLKEKYADELKVFIEDFT